jgi:hypothetical protein
MSATRLTNDDELAHAPESDPLWGESWYFDFAQPDGSFGGYVRLGLYPNMKRAWWWAYLVGDGRPLVVVRDHDVPLPTQGLEVRTEGLWGELVCETPYEHWSIGMEAFGVALDDPADAYRGERGERVAVGLDLEWEERAPVYAYEMTTRYEQACRVTGEVLIGDESIDVDAVGERDHSWGVRDWWAFPWTWTAGQLDDGSAFHAAGTHLHGATVWKAGFVASEESTIEDIESFTTSTTLGAEGFPTAATFGVGSLGDLAVTPLGFGPIELVGDDGRVSRFPRAMCRFTSADGRSGVGWTEWNQPQSPAGAAGAAG